MSVHADAEIAIARAPELIRNAIAIIAREFDINFSRFYKKYGTECLVILAKPMKPFSEMFGIEREISMFFTSFPTVQPRTLQLADSFLQELPALGRAEPIVLALINESATLEQTVRSLTSDNKIVNIVVPIRLDELLSTKDSYFIRNKFREHLFQRDLFDASQPIADERYFFGRREILLDLRDHLARGENVGLFGLRRVGKTSIILRLRDLFRKENNGIICYVNLESQEYYSMRWFELLHAICMQHPDFPKDRTFSEDNAASRFRQFAGRLARPGRSRAHVFAFDEIEHIWPGQAMRPHWNTDFIELWKTIRAVQTEHRSVNFLVCGVNATVVEDGVLNGVDNPLFNMVTVRYAPPFSISELREMCRTLGRYMGIRFEEDVYDYLRKRYAGHPMITRQAVSKHLRFLSGAERPITVSAQSLKDREFEVDNSLIPFGEQIVQLLERYYPAELEMIKFASCGDSESFAEWGAAYPGALRHLNMYGLIEVGSSKLTLPLLSLLVGSKRASPMPKENRVPRGYADDASMIDQLSELGRARNELEILLRKFVRGVLTAKYGRDPALKILYDKLPSERRDKMIGKSPSQLYENTFLLDLLQLIESRWGDDFKVLESGSSTDRVTKAEFTVLLSYVSRNRHDAHAKPNPPTEAVKIAAAAIVRSIKYHLDE